MIKEGMSEKEEFWFDATYGVGNNAVPVIVSTLMSFAGVPAVVTKAVTLTTFATSIFGNSLNQAKLNGYSDSEAYVYAVINTASEVGMEQVLGGISKLAGKYSVSTVLRKSLGEVSQTLLKSSAGRAVLTAIGSYAIQFGSEFVEEGLQTLLSPLIESIATGKYDASDTLLQDALHDALVGGFTGMILSTGDVVKASADAFISTEKLKAIGGKITSSDSDMSNLLEKAKQSSNRAVVEYALQIESKRAAGTNVDLELGTLSAQMFWNEAQNMSGSVDFSDPAMKKVLDQLTDFYKADSSGDKAGAKKVLKEAAVEVSWVSEEMSKTNPDVLSNSEKAAEEIKTEGKRIGSGTENSARTNTAENTDSQNRAKTETNQNNQKNPTGTVTGQGTAAGQTGNAAKADPTAGEAGAQALSDIAETNPGLAEEGIGHTDLVDAYNAGRNGEDISRDTRDNAAAGNYTDSVEAMYNAGQADASKGSVTTGVSNASSSVEGSQGVNPAAETVVTSAAETKSGSTTEQTGTTSTEQSNAEVNAELENQLAPFKLSSSERAAAEEYARTGKDSAISNDFDRDSVKRIMAAAAIVKGHNGKNGIDSRQGEGYNGNAEDTIDGFKIIDGKVGGKIPVEEFKQLREKSIKNPGADSKSMTLGRYDDGGPTSYIKRAGKNSSYFSLGNVWNEIKRIYNLTDSDIFLYFNVPALNDAIAIGKTIRFSHNPLALENRKSFLFQEWKYIKKRMNLSNENLKYDGGFWYVG